MKKASLIVLSGMFLALVWVLGVQPVEAATPPTPTPAEAVILNCTLTGTNYLLTAVSGSSGAPAVTLGTSCGTVLAAEANAGFNISNVQLDGHSMVYTLIKDADQGQGKGKGKGKDAAGADSGADTEQ